MFASFRPVLAKASALLAASAVAARRFSRDRGGNVAMMFAMLRHPAGGGHRPGHRHGPHLPREHANAGRAGRVGAGGRPRRADREDRHPQQGLQVRLGLLRPGQAHATWSSPPDRVLAERAADRVHGHRDLLGEHAVPQRAQVHRLQGRRSDAPAECARATTTRCVKVVSKATAQICLNCSDTGGGNSDDGKKPRDLDDARRHGLDERATRSDRPDRGGQGPGRHRRVGRPEQVHLARGAGAVRAGRQRGPDYFTAITGKSDQADHDGDRLQLSTPQPATTAKRQAQEQLRRRKSEYKVKTYATCVVERTGTEAATDAAPTGADAGFRPGTVPTGKENRTTCTPSAKIVPLTKDRDSPEGYDRRLHGQTATTAGQLGTAFAWYLLSPNWNNVWPADEPACRLRHAQGGQDRDPDDRRRVQHPAGQPVQRRQLAGHHGTDQRAGAVHGDEEEGPGRAIPTSRSIRSASSSTTTASKNLLKGCATSDGPLLRDLDAATASRRRSATSP